MKIITADYTYIDGEYKKAYAVAFEEKIIAAAPFKKIIEQYPDATLMKQVPHSVLYPGLINTHVHLEFSSNRTTLNYGSYIPWLYSVIEDRNHLTETCTTETMAEACQSMMQSGVTALGAISSMGLDLDACITTPQRVIFFNELIGSNPQTVDALYTDFIQRYNSSSDLAKDRVTPAVAIHSPYAVHPIVLKKAVSFAKEKESLISAHFLESEAERQWLDHSEGEFKSFFDSFFNQNRAATSAGEFLSQFDGYPTHFTHCVHAEEKELQKIAQEKHTIAHCPRSNRLLGCGRLDLKSLERLDVPFSLATDGLSSNNSLSIFDELRAALMMHYETNLHILSQRLIRSVTSDAAKILNLKCGQIAEGYEADFALIQLPEELKREEDIALWTILHTDKVKQLFIEGERYI
ncbi:MAG: metal-dependent hydrolase [Campylobacterota bacterium]|nr:metal-dependent hydrolase [Campylobacterota bacterium]